MALAGLDVFELPFALLPPGEVGRCSFELEAFSRSSAARLRRGVTDPEEIEARAEAGRRVGTGEEVVSLFCRRREARLGRGVWVGG